MNADEKKHYDERSDSLHRSGTNTVLQRKCMTPARTRVQNVNYYIHGAKKYEYRCKAANALNC